MPTPGRNDLCPCGSGKKYKRCCLGKEAQREEFVRELESRALPLLRELGQFAARRAAIPPEKVVAERFPFWRPPLNNVQGARLLEYLIFDYHPARYGTSAAHEFAAERGSLLAEPSQRLLRGWLDITTQLFVLESWSGSFASCRRAADPQASLVNVMPLEGDGGKLIPKGRPVALRALPTETAHVYPSWPITFGSRSVIDVMTAVQGRHHAFVRRERIVSFDEFLRLEPTVFDEEAAAGASAARIIIPGQ